MKRCRFVNIKLFLFVLIMLSDVISIKGQVVPMPNYSLKSPETLEIIETDLTAEATIVKASLENRIEGGYFCLDRKTYILTDKGMKARMVSVTGLPECPETYRFRATGEKVYFTIRFEPVPEGTIWFDIIEDCGDNCLAVYGVTTDAGINRKFNSGFMAFENGDNEDAIDIFDKLLVQLKPLNHALLGSVYHNLVILNDRLGRDDRVKELLEEIRSSAIPRKDLVIANLRIIGFDI